MIYLLLLGLFVQLIYCYYVFNKDLFSPSAIICEVFIVSVLACIYNVAGSGYDIQPTTVGVILGGNTVFIVISSIIHFFFNKRHKRDTDEKNEDGLRYIKIRRNIIVITTIAYLAFSLVFIILSISAMNGLGRSDDFSASMNAYRSELIEEGSSLPGPLIKLNAVFETGMFVMIYIFINNFLADRKIKSNYLMLVCIVAYLTSTVFTAQRTTILAAFIFALFVSYFLLNRKYQFIKRMNGKYIRRGLLVVVAFLLLFGATRGLFGRMSDQTAIDSATSYMGYSIELFDSYIRQPLDSKQFGEETFMQARSILSQYGLVEPLLRSPFLEFRKTVSGLSGNIYTGYRGYIHDFGYLSIIPFQIILALFFGIWYEKISRRRLKNGIDLSFIIFAWFMAFGLFRFSIANACFTYMAYFALTTRWIMFLFWKWFFGLKVTMRGTKRGVELPTETISNRHFIDNGV